MAEVLGIASGIAGLLSLTIEVYSTSAHYISGVKNASASVHEVLRELKALKNILSELDQASEHIKSEKIFRDRLSSLLSVDNSEEYRGVLERLQAKLLKQASLTGVSLKLKNCAWPFSEEKTRRTVDLLQSFTTSEILKEVRYLGQDKRAGNCIKLGGPSTDSGKEKKSTTILEWLSSIDMQPKQQDILSRRHGNTGEWILKNESFNDWMHNDSVNFLWCPGGPGVGKTVLTSIVVEHITKYCATNNRAVAFIYCDYQDQSLQIASNLIANLCKQLILRKPTLFNRLEAIYKDLTERRLNPGLATLEDLLLSVCSTLTKPYVVVDALDECSPDQRKILIPILRNLQNASVKVFVTSRSYARDVDRALSNQVRIDIQATKSDLREYIVHQIEDDEDLMELLTDDLRSKVVSTIVDGAGGMFLFAILQIKRIQDQMTLREVKQALETIPVGLSELYTDTLQRIEKQSPKRSRLGMTILGWMSYAKRPILVDELRHALAVGYTKNRERLAALDTENLLQPRLMVDVCGGLVAIDDETQVIRLVHYTTQEYFSKQKDCPFADIQLHIAGTCLSYLLFDEFKTGPCYDGEALQERCRRFKFLEYASCHWGNHVRGPHEAEFLDMILEFLEDDKRVCAVAEVLHTCESEFFRWCNKFGEAPKDFQPLAVAASQGLNLAVKALLDQKMNPSKVDGTFKTPAHWAVWRGHETTLKLLLERGVDVHIRSGDNITLLDAACDQGWENVARLLLDKGFEINTRGFAGANALEISAMMGQESIVRLLLDRGVDWKLKNLFDETVLLKAAIGGHVGIAEMLLEKGVGIECANSCGNTVLHCASFSGQDGLVETLLRAGANPNVRSSNGGTPLHAAASQGHEEVVRLLLHYGADIESKSNNEFESFRQITDRTGKCIPQMVELKLSVQGGTALHEAVKQRQENVVGALVEFGADLNARAHSSHTPLMIAAYSAKSTLKGGKKMDAALKASLAITRSLLAGGADINSVTDFGSNPIHLAASNGGLEIVQLLLERGFDIDLRTPDGSTPLQLACRSGHTSIAKFLIESGADINAASKAGDLVIHCAALGNTDILYQLLEKGIDIEAKDGRGRTPLMRAVMSAKPEIVQFLIDRGANKEYSTKTGTSLFYAVRVKDRVPVIQVLLGAGARLDCTDDQGYQAHHRAAREGNTEGLRLLLAAGAELESRGANKHTPLLLAVAGGHVDTAQVLLEAGAQIDSGDPQGFTPLTIAVYNGHEAVMQLLIRRRANLNQGTVTNLTALMIAAEKRGESTCRLLLENGADINATTVAGLSATHKAAIAGNLPTLRFLLATGCPSGPKNNNGDTPLHLAAWHGHAPAIEELLESGADIDSANNEGETALHLSAIKNHENVLRLLLNRGADPDARTHQNTTALLLAAKQGHTPLVNLLLCTERVTVNWRDEGGEPALYLAATAGHVDAVRALLTGKADPNLKTTRGCAASHRAAQHGHESIVRLLLDAGADPNATDARKCTVLMWAAQFGHVGAVQMLLQRGRVEVNSQAVDGDTALHCAALKGQVEVLRLLLEHGGVDTRLKNNNGLTARDIGVRKQFCDFVRVFDECTGPKSTLQVTLNTIG